MGRKHPADATSDNKHYESTSPEARLNNAAELVETALSKETSPPPDPPSRLSSRAKAHWERLAPLIWRQGLVRDSAVDLLASYVEILDRLEETRSQIRELEAFTVETGTMTRAHPLLSVEQKLIASQNSLASALGLTVLKQLSLMNPSDRPGAVTGADDVPEGDRREFALFKELEETA